jgi:hypothetical protein
MSDPSRRLRRRKCRGKKRFYSRYDANNARLAYERTFGELMDYYYCRYDGGHWHIGHSRKEAYDRIEAALRRSDKRYG